MRRIWAVLLCAVLLATGCTYAAVGGKEDDAYSLYFREADLAASASGDALRAEPVRSRDSSLFIFKSFLYFRSTG